MALNMEPDGKVIINGPQGDYGNAEKMRRFFYQILY